MAQTYQWAHMRQPLPDGRPGFRYDRAYIPSQFAVKGLILTIKDDPGWEVVQVSAHTIPEAQANKMYADRKAFRDKEVAGRPSFKGKKGRR